MPGSLDSFVANLEKLIAKFEADKAHYLSKEYPEAQVRIDFVTPFFKALGWDVENEAELVHRERGLVAGSNESHG